MEPWVMVPCPPQKPLRPVVKKWCGTDRVRCQNKWLSSEALSSWCLGTFPCKTLQWKVDSYLFIAKFNPLKAGMCWKPKMLGLKERISIAITKCWPFDDLPLSKFSASEMSSCGWRNEAREHKYVLWSQAAKKRFYHGVGVGIEWSLRSLPSQYFLTSLIFLISLISLISRTLQGNPVNNQKMCEPLAPQSTIRSFLGAFQCFVRSSWKLSQECPDALARFTSHSQRDFAEPPPMQALATERQPPPVRQKEKKTPKNKAVDVKEELCRKHQ